MEQTIQRSGNSDNLAFLQSLDISITLLRIQLVIWKKTKRTLIEDYDFFTLYWIDSRILRILTKTRTQTRTTIYGYGYDW